METKIVLDSFLLLLHRSRRGVAAQGFTWRDDRGFESYLRKLIIFILRQQQGMANLLHAEDTTTASHIPYSDFEDIGCWLAKLNATLRLVTRVRK